MRVTKKSADHKKIAARIKAIGDKYKVSNYDLLFDLYNLFRNKGKCLDADHKTLDALRKTDPARYWVARDEYHRTRVVFDDISKSDMYKALLTMPPLDALDEVCSMLQKLFVRLKAAKEDPRRNGHRTPQLTQWLDEDKQTEEYRAAEESRAASRGGPSPFNITDPLSLMASLFHDLDNPVAVTLFANGACPYILTKKLDNPHKDAQWLLDTAKRYCARGGSTFFKWINNVAGKAGFEEKKDLVTPELSKHKKDESLEAMSEVVNANPADLQRPDLEKQLIDKTLNVTKNTAATLEKSHSVVLLDVSGSMGCQDMAGGRCDRALYAFCIIFALMQKVIERGDVFHIILFEGVPHACLSASTQQEAIQLVNKMCHHTRWGGGTNIQLALQAGIKKLQDIQKFRHADILLITDGEASVNVKDIRSSLPKNTKIRGIHIGQVSTDAKQQMFDLCDAAMVAEWDDKEDMPKLGTLLKGV